MSCVFATILELQKKQNELEKAKITERKNYSLPFIMQVAQDNKDKFLTMVCVSTNKACSVHFYNSLHSKDREGNIKSRSARKITRAV